MKTLNEFNLLILQIFGGKLFSVYKPIFMFILLEFIGFIEFGIEFGMVLTIVFGAAPRIFGIGCICPCPTAPRWNISLKHMIHIRNYPHVKSVFKSFKRTLIRFWSTFGFVFTFPIPIWFPMFIICGGIGWRVPWFVRFCSAFIGSIASDCWSLFFWSEKISKRVFNIYNFLHSLHFMVISSLH